MIDRALEHQLRDPSLFYEVMERVLIKIPQHKRGQIFHVMEMRLGHATGATMKWREIKEHTYSLYDNTKTVSMMYCQKLYWKGMALAYDELYVMDIPR